MQARPYISSLSPYLPGMSIEQVAAKYGLDPADVCKLASNENPLGPSPKALAAITEILPQTHRYPEQQEVVQKLAEHHGLDASKVVVGNGSNDVLDLIARTYLGPGDEAISSQYAFAIYQIATQSTGASNVVVPAVDFGHDLPAMRAAITDKTKVIWLVNPNNPTGTFLPYQQVLEFIRAVPKHIVVVLDEAYYEFLTDEDREDTVKWLGDLPNLVLVRTFSKMYGLAGWRIGYGMAAPEVIELLNRVRQPFNVNVPAMVGAIAALQDTDFVAESLRVNNLGRTQLVDGFTKLGFKTLPAYGNFVVVEVLDALKINEQLLQRGVVVRPLAGYGMPNHLRVSIGNEAENTTFLTTLERIIQQ